MANDPFLQAASNAVAGAVSTPVDAITWALRKGGLDIKKPVGGSDWMREKGLTAPVEPGGRQILGEVAGSLADPIAPISKAALMVGALRKGLRVGHGLNLGTLPKDLRELYNTSFAVNEAPNLTQKFGGSVLVPKLGKFDPATSNSSLYSTDVGTPEWHGQLPTKVQERDWGRPLNLNAEAAGMPSLSTRENAARRLSDRTSGDMSKYISRGAPAHQTYRSFKELDRKGLPEGSEYGELKAWGSQSLTPNNFAGLITPQSSMDQYEEIINALRKKGIPTQGYQDPKEIGEILDYLQGLRK